MTRVLHMADIHYCPKHLLWADRAMANAVSAGIAEGCKLAIIAGDSFDHALSVHEPAFVAYVRQVVRLAAAMPVLVLQGTHSHDRPGSLDVLKAIPTAHPLVVADWIDAISLAGVRVNTLPSLNKADPAVMAAGANAWTHAKLAEMGSGNAAARDDGIPTILVTHGTVTGCTTESGYAMVSPDLEFSVENLAASDCDAVLLGHIHRHQSWPTVRTPSGALTTIAYPGSLTRLVFGHMEPVGFLIWDLEPGKPGTFKFYESPAPQLLECKYEGPPDMDELRRESETVDDTYHVKVRWEIDEEHAASVDKALIRDLFAKAEMVKLEARVLPVQRVRAAGIGRAMTLEAKLGHWAETTGSMPALPRLTDRLAMVQSMDVEQIVALITSEPETDDQAEADRKGETA